MRCKVFSFADVDVLTGLVPADQEQNDSVAPKAVVDAVAGAEVQAHLENFITRPCSRGADTVAGRC